MVRFAIIVTAVELALTALAVCWIAVVEEAPAFDYLVADELRAIGIPPKDFQRRRVSHLDGSVLSSYTCGLDGRRVSVQADVRLGSGRTRYDSALKVSMAAAHAGGDGLRMKLTATDVGQPEGFWTVRTTFHADGAEVYAEGWLVEEGAVVMGAIKERAIAEDELVERRDWCERQAQTITHILLGAVREELQQKR